MQPDSNPITLPRNLGEGLVLRRATVADTQALVEFNSKIHSDFGMEQPDEKVAAWTQDLMTRPHPTFTPGDFTIVENAKGEVVSSLNLISQTWTYGGIPFPVGRPELVGTHPDYRNRGLVRAQFEVVHQWSAERGESLQGITGIPYYYRMFGYEMALNLGGSRIGYLVRLPELKEGESEPYRLRPAVEADIPFIEEVYQVYTSRNLVACQWGPDLWRYELQGKSFWNVNRRELHIIETPAGEPVGMLTHAPWLWGPTLSVNGYELKPGISWTAVTPSVLRYIQETGKTFAERDQKEPFGLFNFALGAEHPVYQAISDRLPRIRKPYAWYLRVPDLPAFLRRIAPVLEGRLADSIMVNHTGELKISFYQDGVRLVFEAGALKIVEPWKPAPFGHSGQAGFPGLTFLQLLFGYRSFEELNYAFADSWVNGDETRALLQILFPKQVSDVWPIS